MENACQKTPVLMDLSVWREDLLYIVTKWQVEWMIRGIFEDYVLEIRSYRCEKQDRPNF